VPEETPVTNDLHAHTHNFEIEGKTVLITGARGGIGQALVQAFRAAGAGLVIGASRGSAEFGPGTRAISFDVTDAAAVAAAAVELGETVDIIVNSAGFNSNRGVFEAIDDDTARREMEINYFGVLNVARAFAPAFRRRRSGLIVNVLSSLAYVNVPAMGSYCASKAAARSLTQALRGEFAPYGVHVCGFYPGVVDTPMSAHIPPPKLAPAQVGIELLQAIREGADDYHTSGGCQALVESLRTDPKAVERHMAARLPAASHPLRAV
jgi:NAD(P)-dependent dehydrogenase (short-subunit alcohol dehydrogenase family)